MKQKTRGKKRKRGVNDGGEEEEALEKTDPVQLCFDSKIFGSVVLPYCEVKELKALRLVSRSFQASVKKELLSRTFIPFDCIESWCSSGFLKLNDIVRLKFEESTIFHNVDTAAKVAWQQMGNLKHLSVVNCLEPNDVSKWPRVFKTISSLFFEGIALSGELPETLTRLEFGHHFDEPIGRLPNSVLYLEFGRHFNKPVDHLPGSVTHLKFGRYFNKPVDHLPGSVTHLRVGRLFDRPIDRLPCSVTHLRVGGGFNQRIDHLPGSLTHLKLGFDFDKPIDNLPDSIVCLSLGAMFNQPLERLPGRLAHLVFGQNFNQVVSHLLPDSLVRLKFGREFTEPLKSLPASLKRLSLCASTYLLILRESSKLVLRDSLKHLSIRAEFAETNEIIEEVWGDARPLEKRLPELVEHITVTGLFAKNLSPLSGLENLAHLDVDLNDVDDNVVQKGLDKLPDSITHLTLRGFFDQSVTGLPRFLTHLTFGDYFDKPVEGLSETLLRLEFGRLFDQSLDSLPNGLAHLKLGARFNQEVEELPDSIKHLTFGDEFNQKVDRLPRSLITLEFGEKFNRSVDKLPASVEKIVFGREFNQRVDGLPSRVVELSFGFKFNQRLPNLPKSVACVKRYRRSRFVKYYSSDRWWYV